MISNRCSRKSLVINCNLIISESYLQFLVDSNDIVNEKILFIDLVFPSFYLKYNTCCICFWDIYN